MQKLIRTNLRYVADQVNEYFKHGWSVKSIRLNEQDVVVVLDNGKDNLGNKVLEPKQD